MTFDVALSRIETLRALPDGWLDGEGKALSPALIDAVISAVQRLMTTGVGAPYAYPTPDGGIQLAWDVKAGSIELEAAETENGVVWSGLGLRADVFADLENTTDLAQVANWLGLQLGESS